MKKFQTGIMVALAVMIMTSIGVSQQSMGAGGAAPSKQDIAAKLEKISAKLQLTPAQKKQMLPILKEEGPKLEALKSDTGLGPLQKAMRMKQVGAETDAKVKLILTPEQYEKWEAMRAQEREEMMQKVEMRKSN